MARSLPPWLSGRRQTRFLLASVLLALIVAVLGTNLLEDMLVERMRRDCSSLFADRLRPATMMFQLVDQMHLREQALDRQLIEGENGADARLHQQLGQHIEKLEQVLTEFEQTYLVAEEAQLLRELRAAMQSYRSTESEALTSLEAGKPFNPERLREGFARVREELVALSALQENVGQQLERESLASASGVSMLLYVQLAVAFILGLIAAALASSLGAQRSSLPPSKPPSDTPLH